MTRVNHDKPRNECGQERWGMWHVESPACSGRLELRMKS